MPKGSWGDWAVIQMPMQYKKVSCATCTFYNREDKGCEVTAIVPWEDGYDSWKKCSKFDLDASYMSWVYQEQVRKIKGESFFERKREEKAELIEQRNAISRKDAAKRVAREIKVTNKEIDFTWPLKNQIITSFINHMKIEVTIIEDENLVKKNQFLMVNSGAGVIAYVLLKRQNYVQSRYGHKQRKQQPEIDYWFMDLANAVAMLKKENGYSRRLIIIPEIKEEDSSIGELFYWKRGQNLGGIEIVEYMPDARMIVASGPVQKYWTAEKIQNIKIFKES